MCQVYYVSIAAVGLRYEDLSRTSTRAAVARHKTIIQSSLESSAHERSVGLHIMATIITPYFDTSIS